MSLILSILLLLFPSGAGAALSAGETAPDFELPVLAGGTASLSSLLAEGRPVVLSFFGSWCAACLEEIKDFPETAEKNGAAVYLVGLDSDREKLDRFVAKNGIKYPVLWDPRAKVTGRRYDALRGAVLIVPRTVVITPEAEVAYAADAYDEKSKAALEAKLRGLNARQWSKPVEVALFFTGSSNGRLSPGPSLRKSGGGFIKLLPFLREQRKKYPNMLLLDTGDFLPYGVTAAQAEKIFSAMSYAGYDAVALGDQDLHYGGLAPEARRARLPLLSGARDSRPGPPSFPAEKTLLSGGIKIKVGALIGPDAFSFYPEHFAAGFGFKPAAELVSGRGGADVVVLLSHAGPEANMKLAAGSPSPDLIIGGHAQEAAFKAEKAGSTLVLQPEANLQAVGKVLLRFNAKKRLIGAAAETVRLEDSMPDDERIASLLPAAKAK